MNVARFLILPKPVGAASGQFGDFSLCAELPMTELVRNTAAKRPIGLRRTPSAIVRAISHQQGDVNAQNRRRVPLRRRSVLGVR